MPELPEVETVVRGLRKTGLAGVPIAGVRVAWPRSVGGHPSAFAAALQGRRILTVARRAKYILMELDDGRWLAIHLRMTGRLSVLPAESPRDPHDHVVLAFADGRELRFRDPRKFGRWNLLDSPLALDRRLGPEPLAASFTAGVLAGRLASRRGRLKPLLLDQRVVAGIGNIYADEALWRARLHPERRAETLTPAEIGALHAAIRFVLRRGIRGLGTSLSATSSTSFRSLGNRPGRHQESLDVFRRTGSPCPACGAPVERRIVGQRATHLCPRCQPAPAARRP